MVSAFETFRRLGPAAFVLKAILSVIVADVLLLGFIMLRRTYRKRYFAKRDARLFEIRESSRAILGSAISNASNTIVSTSCRSDGFVAPCRVGISPEISASISRGFRTVSRHASRNKRFPIGSPKHDKAQQQYVCDDHREDRLQHERCWT